MKGRGRDGRSSRAGLTVLEMVIATSIFVVVGYALVGAVQMGSSSQQTVYQVVSSNEDVREANTALTEELKTGGDSTVTVTTLGDGNHEMTFMQPVEVGTGLGWGVFDESFGATPEEQNKPDWQIRYTVKNVPLDGGGFDRRLVRQVLDEESIVQGEEVVMEGLRSGAESPPGFSVVQVGDMWEITVTTVGHSQNNQGQGANFHVHMRN